MDFCKWWPVKVDVGDDVVAFYVDVLSLVVFALLVVYGGSVVITGIAPNVPAGLRKPRKRERSYFAARCIFPKFDTGLDNICAPLK